MNEREELPITVYTPDSAIASPARLARDMIRDIHAARDLAWRLAVRDISAQYRQTLLGFFWIMALPLAHTVIWVFLGTSGAFKVGPTTIPYPAFVLIGTMLWAIFVDAVQAPLQGVTESRDMLAKINFPREAIIISGMYQVAFNAGIKLAILLVALPLLGLHFDWHLALAPLGVCTLMLVGLALGLFVTPLGLLYTDVAKGLPLLMQFMMFLTPVVYPLPDSGTTRTLLMLNPLTSIIEATRQWLTGSPAEMVSSLLLIGLAALLMTVVLWVVYRLAMPIVIERVSS